MFAKKLKPAFTLVEIMVVVVIIGLLGGSNMFFAPFPVSLTLGFVLLYTFCGTLLAYWVYRDGKVLNEMEYLASNFNKVNLRIRELEDELKLLKLQKEKEENKT